jgi:hypothetical protein
MLFTLNTLRTSMLRGWTILTVTVCLLAAPLFAEPMTKEDREHLLVHFEMTTQMVAEQVRGGPDVACSWRKIPFDQLPAKLRRPLKSRLPESTTVSTQPMSCPD